MEKLSVDVSAQPLLQATSEGRASHGEHVADCRPPQVLEQDRRAGPKGPGRTGGLARHPYGFLRTPPATLQHDRQQGPAPEPRQSFEHQPPILLGGEVSHMQNAET
eukprot:scaffold95413_cov15-Tisochrysis_lutea.AAC.2